MSVLSQMAKNTLCGVNDQIQEVQKKASDLGVRPEQMQDASGRYLMVDLLLAKSNCLMVLSAEKTRS